MGKSIYNVYPLFRKIYIYMTLYKYNNTMWIIISAMVTNCPNPLIVYVERGVFVSSDMEVI